MTESGARDDFARRLDAAAKAGAERLHWPAERMAAYRNTRLRQLLGHARQHSRWHADHLRDIDLDRITVADLAAIPPMTKEHLLENWDGIVTDRSLTMARAEENLRACERLGRPALLDDRYATVASSGASGPRSVVIWALPDLLEAAAAVARTGIGRLGTTPRGEIQARLFSAHPANVGSVIGWLTRRPNFQTVNINHALPWHAQLELLNELQPTMVSGYGSQLSRLAAAQRTGQLRISPKLLGTSAEPVSAEAWDSIEAAFGAPLIVEYSSTECLSIAASFPTGRVLQLFEDINVLEPVDEHGQSVEPGVASRSVYVTSLINRAMPFIRYELRDEVTIRHDPVPSPWRGRQLERIDGRWDDWFCYDGIEVHPTVFRSVLYQLPTLAYQVRQTERGADVLAIFDGHCDTTAAAAELTAGLAELGLRDPVIRITAVDELPRLPGSGKLRYFLPLPPH